MAGCGLTALRCHEGGALVAAGCADGTVSVLQLSAGLVEPQPSEKAATLAVLVPETLVKPLFLALFFLSWEREGRHAGGAKALAP